MRLIIARHGKAERDSPTGRDEDRALRDRGRHQARHLGHELAALTPRPDLILSSGLTRAVQTAREIEAILNCPLCIERVLEPARPVSKIVEAVRVVAIERRSAGLVLVGHNPTFEELVGALLRGPGGAPVPMRTGQAAVLTVPEDEDEEWIGACHLDAMLRLEGDD